MSTSVEISQVPQCDLCALLGKSGIPAYANASIPRIGSWAFLCRRHFTSLGCRLDTGRDQELVK